MSDILLLRRSDVLALLEWPDVIDAVAAALVTRATDPANAASSQVAIPGGSLHLKAGALAAPPVLSVKANIRPDAGRAEGVLVLYDTARFAVRAILDSRDLTAMRTAGLAAVAVRALAGQIDGSGRRLAVLGSGPVARSVLDAVPQVVKPDSLALWSRERANAEALGTGTVYDTPAAAVAGADIVITCTPSRTPLLAPGDMRDGALLVALGSDSPGKRELAPGLLAGADLFVDGRDDAAAVGETGHALREGSTTAATELGDVLAGKVALPAQRGRLTVFDSVGSATIDAAVAARVVELAEQRGIGTPFALSD